MTLDPDMSFRAANGAALLASAARTPWAPVARRLAGRWLPLALALLATHWRGQGGFGSLAEVQALFEVPGALTAGWVHYLAFDLFVGGWIATRAAETGMHHALLVPVLLLTFLFGPAGLLLFALLKPREVLA